MDAAKLIERLLAQRESWVELQPAADGKPALRVKVRRPAEAEFGQYRRISVDQAAECTVGWEGFSEATLIGSALGSSDPLPFAPELWREVVRDRVEWLNAVAAKIVEQVSAHIEAKVQVSKN